MEIKRHKHHPADFEIAMSKWASTRLGHSADDI